MNMLIIELCLSAIWNVFQQQTVEMNIKVKYSWMYAKNTVLIAICAVCIKPVDQNLELIFRCTRFEAIAIFLA